MKMCGKLMGHREECCGVVVLFFGVLYWEWCIIHTDILTCACTDIHIYMHVCTFPQAYSLSQNEVFFSRYECMCVCMRVCVYYDTGELLALKIKWEFSFTCLQRNYLGFLLRASVRAVLLTCARRSKWTIVLLRFVMRRMIHLRVYSSQILCIKLFAKEISLSMFQNLYAVPTELAWFDSGRARDYPVLQKIPISSGAR